MRTVPQPPFSLDFAPCDFWLFPKLKPLRGHRFDTIEEIQAESKNKCFDDCRKRWNKCIISGGDYFEWDEIDLGR